jgi:predicted Zn-dependent protease
MPSSPRQRFYHGGADAVFSIDPARVGADGEILCASASVNVAQRYGDVISTFEIATDRIERITVSEWFGADSSSGGEPVSVAEHKRNGVEAIVVTGSAESFDFPSDTLFVLTPNALEFVKVLTTAEINIADEGFAVVHDPEGPGHVGWELFVRSNGDGEDIFSESKLKNQSHRP